MEGAGIHWDATTDLSKRREITLQILRQMPVLWIWDNVEPITGFPAGTKSEWSIEEQQELRTFLSAARDTKAKFLLTSRRDEGAWLSELPRRVRVPPMPMRERLQLASAIVEHRGKRLADLPDFQPLLRFTHGNPLTILVAVGEALRAGIDTKDHLDMYVEALRDGERSFEDEEPAGPLEIPRRVAFLWLRPCVQRRRAKNLGAPSSLSRRRQRGCFAGNGQSRRRVVPGSGARADA